MSKRASAMSRNTYSIINEIREQNRLMNTQFKTTAVMTGPQRQEWLGRQRKYLAEQFEFKFMKGQTEHGSDLGQVPMTTLLSHMEDEAIDQLAYVAEIRRRLLPETKEESIPIMKANYSHPDSIGI